MNVRARERSRVVLSSFAEQSGGWGTRWWRSRKPVQRVVHKGSREPIGRVKQSNGRRRENGSGEGRAFQDARDSFKIILSIARGTAGHVGLIGHRYFGRRR